MTLSRTQWRRPYGAPLQCLLRWRYNSSVKWSTCSPSPKNHYCNWWLESQGDDRNRMHYLSIPHTCNTRKSTKNGTGAYITRCTQRTTTTDLIETLRFWYEGELWSFDNYIIPLATKLMECEVFGVSCDEFLNFANKNRKEWAVKGWDMVAQMLLKILKRRLKRRG